MEALRSLLSLLWRTVRIPFGAAVALSIVLSFTEGVGVAMILPLLGLLGHPGALGGRFTRALYATLTMAHVPVSWWLAVLLIILLATVGLLSVLNGVLTSLTWTIVAPVRQKLATELYAAILHADWAFLTRRRTSDLTHFLTAELNRVGQAVVVILAILSNGVVALFMLALAVYSAPVLAMLLLAGLLTLVPWQRRVGRRIFRSGMALSERGREVFDSSMERLSNLKVVKAYGAQNAELALFSSRHDSSLRELVANHWQSTMASRSFQLATLGFVCALVLVGLQFLHLAAGTLLVFLFAFVRATPRVNNVQSKISELLTDLPAYGELQSFLEECRRHSELEQDIEPAPALVHELALDQVFFRYSPEAPQVLVGVDLAIEVGQITAVSGPSGAGKSTIADLVMGLLQPDAGLVTADAYPITRANARAWRSRVGYVSQDTPLFHDTVRRNLLWARPETSDDELAAALKDARADFVYTLAEGLDTTVGDRGIMLSHGQRQRLALARALLLRPSLLILDEATNSLDVENEAAILATVAALRGAVTTLLISHRPSALRFADRVYRLEDGRIQSSKLKERS